MQKNFNVFLFLDQTVLTPASSLVGNKDAAFLKHFYVKVVCV